MDTNFFGPWVLDENGFLVSDANGIIIGDFAPRGGSYLTRDEHQAAARLASLAPEMLDLLKRFTCDHVPSTDPDQADALALIRRAYE